MTQIKLTKHELKSQRARLAQLERYLPTLQLKKAMLQSEVGEARLEILTCEEQFNSARLNVSHNSSLFSEQCGFDLVESAQIAHVETVNENIAGVDIPVFKNAVFKPFEYSLLSTPAWLDAAVQSLRLMVVAKIKVSVAQAKKAALEKELREVSIRVNLFEKSLIPKAYQNIKKICVFLGDQELAAVGRAKAAKSKIEKRQRHAH